MERAAIITGGSSGIGLASDQMIQPEDCAAIVRMLLALSPGARIPQVVIERAGSVDGDRRLLGA